MTGNARIQLPSLHMAGSNAHADAHLELGEHGFALFLTPDAEYPLLDINGTSEQLGLLVRSLQAALASRPVPTADARPPLPSAGLTSRDKVTQ